jgi:flagellar export protein FliJ
MAFRFPLQPLLRFRESFEHRERLRLELATREVVRARRQSEEARSQRTAALHEMSRNLVDGLVGVELHLEVAFDMARARRLVALGKEVERLDVQRRDRFAAYRKAQQQLKILENLRARQMAAYRLEQERRVQQQMDEMYLLRHRGPGLG